MLRINLSKDEKQYILDNYNKKSAREMAEWIGCSVYTIDYHLRKNGLRCPYFSRWSPEKKAELLELRKNGMSRKDLAKRFNTTEQSIHGIIYQMRKNGIEVPKWREVMRIRKARNEQSCKD